MEEKYLLHNAVIKADADGVRELIKQDVDLNQLDDLGDSPLHWAVLGGYDDIVKLLLEAGANPNIISSSGYSPKWSACDFGLKEIEELLSSYGGKVLTDNSFDRVSWSVFKGALGQPMPKEDER